MCRLSTEYPWITGQTQLLLLSVILSPFLLTNRPSNGYPTAKHWGGRVLCQQSHGPLLDTSFYTLWLVSRSRADHAVDSRFVRSLMETGGTPLTL